MDERYNFRITARGPVSQLFLSLGITGFHSAAQYIGALPYRRNTNKDNPAVVFADLCGTCSTKHAVLKQLADENGFTALRLMLGMFRMNARNSPKVAATLTKYGLEYIPEAHNYLKFHDAVLDFTFSARPSHFVPDLIEETEIIPGQIPAIKCSIIKRICCNGWHKTPTSGIRPVNCGRYGKNASKRFLRDRTALHLYNSLPFPANLKPERFRCVFYGSK